VKKLATSLLAWILLLALPFQAVAAVAMLPCAMQAPAHHQARSTEHAHHTAGQHQHPHQGKTHAGCGSCTACCPAAFMTAPAIKVTPLTAGATEAAVFVDRHHASVDLALPERPPSARFA
jgi:hypothetical protein